MTNGKHVGVGCIRNIRCILGRSFRRLMGGMTTGAFGLAGSITELRSMESLERASGCSGLLHHYGHEGYWELSFSHGFGYHGCNSVRATHIVAG